MIWSMANCGWEFRFGTKALRACSKFKRSKVRGRMTPWESSSGSKCYRCSNRLRVSIARDEYLDSQPQAVRGFLRAYVESVRYYKTHRAEAVKKIIALSKLPDPKWASAVYDNSLCSTPDDGKPTL